MPNFDAYFSGIEKAEAQTITPKLPGGVQAVVEFVETFAADKQVGPKKIMHLFFRFKLVEVLAGNVKVGETYRYEFDMTDQRFLSRVIELWCTIARQNASELSESDKVKIGQWAKALCEGNAKAIAGQRAKVATQDALSREGNRPYVKLAFTPAVA